MKKFNNRVVAVNLKKKKINEMGFWLKSAKKKRER